VRREIGKVRSPRLLAHHEVDVGLPLEFEEEDEDFVLSSGGDGDGGTPPSRDCGESISGSTPSSDPVYGSESKDTDSTTWPEWGSGDDGTGLEQTTKKTRTGWAEKLDPVRVEGG
jgi:hypothetical protein